MRLTSIALAAGLVVAIGGYADAGQVTGANANGHAQASGQGSKQGGGTIIVESRSSSYDLNSPITLHRVSDARSRARAAGNGSGGGNLARARAAALAHVGAQIDPKTGLATVSADADVRTRARGKKLNGQSAAVGVVGPHLHAQATGGARPKASTYVLAKNGKVITQARAVAGKGATASGGTTTITHFGPHNANTLAVTYTPHAYSAAVSTRHTATAYSGYSQSGVVFKGATLIAALQQAAYVYARGENNRALGIASANGTAGARAGNALAYADVGVYAQAWVEGDTVILKAGKANGKLPAVLCQQSSYLERAPEVILTCRSLPVHKDAVPLPLPAPMILHH